MTSTAAAVSVSELRQEEGEKGEDEQRRLTAEVKEPPAEKEEEEVGSDPNKDHEPEGLTAEEEEEVR